MPNAQYTVAFPSFIKFMKKFSHLSRLPHRSPFFFLFVQTHHGRMFFFFLQTQHFPYSSCEKPYLENTISNRLSLAEKVNPSINSMKKRVNKTTPISTLILSAFSYLGMCDKKLIFLDDLNPWIEISTDWVLSHTPLLAIRPPPDVEPADVVAKMNEGLKSEKVKNGQERNFFKKNSLWKKK
jgi:hypothetical protein